MWGKNRLKARTYEYILYAVLLGVALIWPFAQMTRKMVDGEAFQWTYILESWTTALPFAILLSIHVFVLLPILFNKKQTRKYILFLVLLVASFFAYMVWKHQPRQHPRHFPVEMPMQSYPPPKAPIMRPEPLPPHDVNRIHIPVIIDMLVAFLLIGCSLIVKLMFKHHEGVRRMEELEKVHIQQELAQLKAQISPHFFMNSLNNIHGMVEIDPQKAQDMILDLSGMMRYVLYESTSSTIALSKEMDFLKNYISLMNVRYSGNRLAVKYTFPAQEESVQVLIPPLIFIIFIENAFKHGIDYKHSSFINIEMSIAENRLTLQCVNSRHPDTLKKVSGGVGLSNIRKRLDILYPDNYILNISEQEKSFQVTRTIPIKS